MLCACFLEGVAELIAELKRKMRVGAQPGDWYCTACNAQNFASRVACFKCSETQDPTVAL